MTLSIGPATAADAAELAQVAAATFPLACPPSSPPDDVAAFIAANLSNARFADYLADPARTVLAAREDGAILGYAMLVRGAGDDPDVTAAVTLRPAMELSKMYVLAHRHGAGVAGSLMKHAIQYATDSGAQCVWLGVNQQNQRAQRFYGKHGFTVAGTKTFTLGAHTEHDYVMVRPL
ncbi:GNAT family N-acetyltransferase [Mycobacterium sp. M26]|uniref:GNAT family N-acetyltransferase n=1 Tax=Mycobacterium sp. M26 TaxID=1762962 RepID=UPI00073E2863|nr:GNAT family N-acetyltransferase [Mycobacterium sp. M26]